MYLSESILGSVMLICFTVLILHLELNPWWLLVPMIYSVLVWLGGCGRSDARKCAFQGTINQQ